MINYFTKNAHLEEFCSFVTRHKLNKGAKVCGVDLKLDYVGFKLYIELLNIPSKEIVLELLEPNSAAEFFKWSAYWDSSRESSLAFGIKIDNNNLTRKYFHIKFKQNFNQILYSNRYLFLKMLQIDINKLLKGISYEIESDNRFYSKFYVYIKDPLDIEKVLIYKKMMHNLDINEIEELELYATENSFKVNVINKTKNSITNQDVWQTISEELKPSLRQWTQVLNCEPMYTGITSSGVTSVYFSFTKKKNNILNL